MPSPTLKDYALTSVEALLRHLGEPADTSGTQGDKAIQLINGYSAAALRYLKRKWKPVEDAADKIFSYTGDGFLSMRGFEARAIHTVTLYTDMPESGWIVLANHTPTQEAQWRPNPRNQTEWGTYTYLTLPEIGPYHPYYDEPITTLNRRNLEYQVTINADWGVTATEIPDDVELAVWIACSNAWRNPEAYQRRQLGPLAAADYESYVPGTEEGLSLPRASRSLLSPYRRKTGVR